MSLKSTAQELIVIDPREFHRDEMPVEVSMVPNDHELGDSMHGVEPELQISDNGNEQELVIELSDLPGAPEGTEDPKIESTLEVIDEPKEEDQNDLKAKKNEKWDWESKGPDGFIVWIKERIDGVPKHSGYDSAGLERAISYMEKLDNEISRAMRLDLDGELDANKIEEVRSKIDDGLSRLHDRLDKTKKSSKTRRKKKADAEHPLVKEGQKITGIQGVFVTVPLLISGIGRVCINGTISAGHDIEEIYKDQVEKYALNDREKAEVRWFLFDAGFPIRGDRGYMPDEDQDSADGKYDYNSNYKG